MLTTPLVVGSLHFLRLSNGPDFHEEVREDEFDEDEEEEDGDKVDEEESREPGDEVKRCDDEV